MAGKKKISKKELLKKPDEFITLSTRTLNWVKDNYLKSHLDRFGIGLTLNSVFWVYRLPEPTGKTGP